MIMAERGQATYQEILSQPTVWRQALEGFYPQVGPLLEFFDRNPFDRAIFTGCGSTYYLSLTAASIFQESVKIPAQARPASELLLFPNLDTSGIEYPAGGNLAFRRNK